jgi:hypothetical protein
MLFWEMLDVREGWLAWNGDRGTPWLYGEKDPDELDDDIDEFMIVASPDLAR